MKRLILLGGMTPDATVVYYHTINRVTRSALGARHTAPLYLFSPDFEEMVQLAGSGDWDAFAQVYGDAIDALASKVDGVVVCAILAHKICTQLQYRLAVNNLPLLHIADCLGNYLRTKHPYVRTLGILGPKVTMLGGSDSNFFIGRLVGSDHGFQVLVPATAAQLDEVDRGMMDEVSKGVSSVTPETKAMFIRNALRLVDRGAQAIVLGSTDLGFVVHQEDVGDGALVIEPASIHAEEVAKWALQS